MQGLTQAQQSKLTAEQSMQAHLRVQDQKLADSPPALTLAQQQQGRRQTKLHSWSKQEHQRQLQAKDKALNEAQQAACAAASRHRAELV